MEGLSTQQIVTIVSSYTFLMRDPDGAAGAFYEKMFELDPNLQKLFTADMREQKVKFNQMMTTIVRSLEHADRAQPVVTALGKRHVGYGVREDFLKIGSEALLHALRTCLGERFTAEVEEAWHAAIRHIIGVMGAAMSSQ